jgi:hypothetical protein
MPRSLVVLRPPTADDEAQFLTRMRASRALHTPWISMPRTSEQYAAYLERSRQDANAFYLAHRREDDAIVGFLSCREIVGEKDWRGRAGTVGVAEAIVLAYEDRLDEANALFAEALETLQHYRLRGEEADALYEWAGALRRAGDAAAAGDKLAAARDIYRSDGAGAAWLDRLELDAARLTTTR